LFGEFVRDNLGGESRDRRGGERNGARKTEPALACTCLHESQPRTQGLLAFQNGGGSGEGLCPGLCPALVVPK